MIAIRNLVNTDWAAVREIYAQGIATGDATLETAAPEWEIWDRSHTAAHRYVAISETGEIAGWTALTPVSGRCVYAGVAEVSVYVAAEYRGMRVGDTLLKHLIAESEKSGYWTLQAGIFNENNASMKLHQTNGFRVIGYRENIGKMNGIWRSVNLLERRSKITGIN